MDQANPSVIQLPTPPVLPHLKPFCKERLVFILDISHKGDQPFARKKSFFGSNSVKSRFQILSDVVKTLLAAKHRMNPKHEFALCALSESAVWVSEWSNKPKKVLESFKSSFTPSKTPVKSCDLESVFQALAQHAQPFPKTNRNPSYYVHAVFIYLRTSQPLTFSISSDFAFKLLKTTHTCIDFLHLHSKSNDAVAIASNMGRFSRNVVQACDSVESVSEFYYKALVHPFFDTPKPQNSNNKQLVDSKDMKL